MQPAKTLHIRPSNLPWSPVSSKSATASALRAARLTGFPRSTCCMKPPMLAAARAVFFAFVPLWQAINGNNETDSPYRRMIAGAAAEAAKNGSEIDNAARDVGIDPAEVERWLMQILDAWRESSSDAMIEPWNFRFQAGEADRLLGTYIPRESLQPINQRYYRDLGADLEYLGTLYDLSPRPEKAALAYTEFVTHGRMVKGVWRPTVARVSAPYERGGLFVLNEL